MREVFKPVNILVEVFKLFNIFILVVEAHVLMFFAIAVIHLFNSDISYILSDIFFPHLPETTYTMDPSYLCYCLITTGYAIAAVYAVLLFERIFLLGVVEKYLSPGYYKLIKRFSVWCLFPSLFLYLMLAVFSWR